MFISSEHAKRKKKLIDCFSIPIYLKNVSFLVGFFVVLLLFFVFFWSAVKVINLDRAKTYYVWSWLLVKDHEWINIGQIVWNEGEHKVR